MTPDTAADLVVERTIELAAIPAPPLDESDRAAVVASWWRHDGLEPSIDKVGNVRARIRAGDGDAIVVCAHLDTVFARSVPHRPLLDGQTLHGPGVGDDTIGVAALSTLDTLLPEHLDVPVWIVATVGEEGLGNLRGAHHLVAAPPAPLRALIAVEGTFLGRIAMVGVGSVRWRIELTGPGGHAWEASHQPSAVHKLAATIVHFESMLAAVPGGARSSLNVGSIEGGEAINARATRAAMTVDIRSDDLATLTALEAAARTFLDADLGKAIAVHVEELGIRPAGRIAASHPLVEAANAGLSEIGRSPDHTAASTDANAAYAADVAAIALGITTGEGVHTTEEWIDISQVADGLRALVKTIVVYDRSAGRS